MTGWFACDEGDETEVLNPRFPWQPVLQLEGHQVRLGIWFATKDACLEFITDHVIGKAMHPLSCTEERSRMPDHQHVLAKDPRREGYACVIHGCAHFVHVTEFDVMAFLESTQVTQRHQCRSEA